MRKICVTLIAIMLAASLLMTPARGQDQKAAYDKLKREYDAVLVDRDNLLVQLKSQGEYRGKYQQQEALAKQLQAEKAGLEQEAASRQDQIAALKQQISDLEADSARLNKESQESAEALKKLSIEYKLLPEIKKEMAQLKSENASLQRSNKQMEVRLKQLQQQKIDDDAQIEVSRMQIRDLKKQYEKAMATNKELARKAEQLPDRFSEIARQNKVLIKETALMHYNLGVFYTKNKEYARAMAEFEKAAELNPDDPSTYYNLGYISAEYLVNRPKSIEYFRKFLSLAKTEDKDVDWVKKYILTWQTWEAKKPLN